MQSGILGYRKFLDWQLLEFWTMKLWLNIKLFSSKTWKKPNIVKIKDKICKKVHFSKLNVKFIYLFFNNIHSNSKFLMSNLNLNCWKFKISNLKYHSGKVPQEQNYWIPQRNWLDKENLVSCKAGTHQNRYQ